MLHNSSYDFNDDVLSLGATYWVRLVEKFLRTRLRTDKMNPESSFSASYRAARARFLSAAARADSPLTAV